MTGLPAINSLVELIVDDERVYRSRIEDDAVDDRLTVAAPIGAGNLEPPQIGSPLDLSWVDGRNRHLVPVLLEDLARLSRTRASCWRVRVTGEIHRENRRMYVRGGGGEPASIIRTGFALAKTRTEGRVVDVSEGGVRLWMPTCPYRCGEQAGVELTLGGEVVHAPGQVLRANRCGPGREGFELVLTYDLPESTAQVVRRYVMERQIADRRLRLEAAA